MLYVGVACGWSQMEHEKVHGEEREEVEGGKKQVHGQMRSWKR